jgi:hypothetical protein
MANEEDINDDIDNILRYCGFAIANDMISIARDGFETFEDTMTLPEKDVSSLTKGYRFVIVLDARDKVVDWPEQRVG